MRTLLFAAVMVGCGTSVSAQDQVDTRQQFLAVMAGLGTDILMPEEFLLGYPAHLAQGLDGRWIDAASIGYGGMDERGIDRVCDRLPMIIDADPMTIRMTRMRDDGAFTTTYQAIGGASFLASTPASDLKSFLGGDDLPPSALLHATAANNGATLILRPQPDILMLFSGTGGIPRILARCPD